jgi:hypothetical protein
MDVARLRTSAQAFQKKIKNEVWSQATSFWVGPPSIPKQQACQSLFS